MWDPQMDLQTDPQTDPRTVRQAQPVIDLHFATKEYFNMFQYLSIVKSVKIIKI